MKEALDRIKGAEQANEVQQQALLQELSQLQLQKDEEVRFFVEGLKEQRNQQLKEKEANEDTVLQAEKQQLLQDAAAEKETFQKQYDTKHEALVAEIIEKVSHSYGS